MDELTHIDASKASTLALIKDGTSSLKGSTSGTKDEMQMLMELLEKEMRRQRRNIR